MYLYIFNYQNQMPMFSRTYNNGVRCSCTGKCQRFCVCTQARKKCDENCKKPDAATC